MTIQDFKAKWLKARHRKESAASKEHFGDLCRALGQPTPLDVDPEGTWYAFEYGVNKTSGGKGFADVWKRNFFGWEYKGPRANLDDAYQQLLQYREDLENPPLLVVCDLDRFEIHTNFTGTAKQIHEFDLETIDEPENIKLLQAVFTNPNALKPKRTVESVTEEAAERFGNLAMQLAERGIDPGRGAHFLVQVLFCLFSEDIGLLKKGLFGDLLTFGTQHPERFTLEIEKLFSAMRDGGYVNYDEIARFNGGLYEHIDIIELTPDEIAELASASKLDWTAIEPAIIGTLFERSLDPARRSQLGAHYTGRADIERVVDPVVMTPLRRRWDAVRAEAEAMRERWLAAGTVQTRRNREADFAHILQGFQDELTKVTVLDPACGSGNFLYVALNKLLDLEKEVITFGTSNGLSGMFPLVRPTQLRGLEINWYARELTQVVIWIGYLQWMTANGFNPSRNPVLGPMDNIKLQDALLDRSDPDEPKEAVWPAADYIIGNPPFLGSYRLRSELGDEYAKSLFSIYGSRIPNFSDLCCYFFEKARNQIGDDRSERAGLLATNSIRGGANREVLRRIKESGDIYMAWPDEPWVLEGAAVRISIVGFDDGSDTSQYLEGQLVTQINADLTASIDITSARILSENQGLSYKGVDKNGPFDLRSNEAMEMLTQPRNPNGRPNSDVVRPFYNAIDVARRPRNVWVIDFADMNLNEAAFYEMPFEYVKKHVQPVRQTNNRASYREYWWLHGERRTGMRRALDGLDRFIVTPHVAKHRVFLWVDKSVLPSNALIAFARDDDYFFGVLHSRAHEVWSLRMGTWLGKGNDPRYTSTTTFETFPFPRPTEEQREAIGAAAKLLDERRNSWLNPEGASEAELKKRTLTNLYNQRPAWLEMAHAALDRAVWDAYGWPEEPGGDDEEMILGRLLELNLERAAEE